MTSTDQQEFKFYDGLFEEICSIENLNEAFQKVKSNKGAPGIDGVTVERFSETKEKEIVKLKQEVENWTYKPSPVKRVEIPKPNGGVVRLLGIPTVRDITICNQTEIGTDLRTFILGQQLRLPTRKESGAGDN